MAWGDSVSLSCYLGERGSRSVSSLKCSFHFVLTLTLKYRLGRSIQSHSPSPSPTALRAHAAPVGHVLARRDVLAPHDRGRRWLSCRSIDTNLRFPIRDPLAQQRPYATPDSLRASQIMIHSERPDTIHSMQGHFKLPIFSVPPISNLSFVLQNA